MLGAVEPKALEEYRVRNRERALACYKVMTHMMISNSLVKIKEAPPYAMEAEGSVLLNSMARATYDEKTGSYSFPEKLATTASYDVSNVEAAAKSLASAKSSVGVGVDHGETKYFA